MDVPTTRDAMNQSEGSNTQLQAAGPCEKIGRATSAMLYMDLTQAVSLAATFMASKKSDR